MATITSRRVNHRPSLPVMAVLMIPLGIPLSPALGSLSASVQRAVPAGSITEAFTWTFAVITITIGMAAGSACGGVIIQAASTDTAFLTAGGLALAGAAAGATRLLARHPATRRNRRPRRYGNDNLCGGRAY